jgi:hypothetical protein
MSLTKTTSIIGIALVLFAANVFGSGTTAADFLNIGVSAHQQALGGSGSTLANDISSAFVNPAGISFIDRPGATFMHNLWYQDISYEYLGSAIPLGNKSVVGVSAVYLHMGKIDAYNAYDQQIGSISPYSIAAIASYSYRISDNISLGLNGKVISEKLADKTATGYAVDLGGQYLLNNFAFGLAINNIGPSMKYESASYKLPTAVSAGIGYMMPTLPVSVMVGARKAVDQQISLATGIEYALNDYFSLRTGYGAVGETNVSSDINFGAGFRFNGGTIDYAFNPGENLGATHAFSFTFNFGRPLSAMFSEKSGSVDNQARNQPEFGTESQNQDKTDKVKKIYIVSAGKFNNPVSAQSQIDMFKKLGVKGKSELTSDGQYRVVLARTDKLSKAQKIHREASAKGLVCALETE